MGKTANFVILYWTRLYLPKIKSSIDMTKENASEQ